MNAVYENSYPATPTEQSITDFPLLPSPSPGLSHMRPLFFINNKQGKNVKNAEQEKESNLTLYTTFINLDKY